MRGKVVVLLTVMAATLLACAGVVLAQGTGRETKPSSDSDQPAKGEVIPGRYIVVLEDDGNGEVGAWAAGERREAQEVAGDLAQQDKASVPRLANGSG